MKFKEYVQNIGRSLMVPVATLPAAAIFAGISYWIQSVAGQNVITVFMFNASIAILGNLGILFAVGLAFGMARDHDGASALAGLVGYLTVIKLLAPASVAQFYGTTEAKLSDSLTKAFSVMDNSNVFVGIISGLIAAAIYNKYHTVRLPAALAFFSGKRLVPILTVAAMAVVSIVLFFVWPFVFMGLTNFGRAIMSLGPIGAAIYAFFNRLLIPTGLHHALNNVFWFNIAGIDDINRFWQGAAYKGAKLTVPGYYPGMYQAGFFPVMMFGLPAGAFAIYKNARPERKKVVGSIMLSAAVASFFTGVTEPLEFSFMFVAFPLYVVHAFLTALAVGFTAFMHWAAGFQFSAGLVDFVLSWPVPSARQPYMLLVEGVVLALIYYFVFDFAIRHFNLATPGREPEGAAIDPVVADSTTLAAAGETSSKENNGEDPYLTKGRAIYNALGSDENVESVDYCTTRLRVVVKDMGKVDQNAIRATGVPAVKVLDDHNIQVIVGTDVQFVNDAVHKLMPRA